MCENVPGLKKPGSLKRIMPFSKPATLNKAVALYSCALALLLLSGCETASETTTTTAEPKTTSTAAYQRQQPGFYRGMAEPRSGSWEDLANDAVRLRADGFNTAMISPPVLINQRAGGKLRVGLEGAAASASTNIEDLHSEGLATFLAPTTDLPGFRPEVEPTDVTLGHLDEDAVRWATTAEQTQTELFSPLSEVNLAIGTDAAGKWSAQILPKVREVYRGEVVAIVVPDIASLPAAGAPHDFELINYTGYDYLLVDIFPKEVPYDETRFMAQVNEIMQRAAAVARRDGLKGFMIQYGSWREAAGVDTVDGPELGEDGQARSIGQVLGLAITANFPQLKGIFFQGWTLPGRGAKDLRAEQTLRDAFRGKSNTIQ